MDDVDQLRENGADGSQEAFAAATSGSGRPRPVMVAWVGRFGLLVALVGLVTRGLVAPLGLGICVAAINRRLTAVGLIGALIGLGGTITALEFHARPAHVDIREQPRSGELMAAEKQLAMIQGWFKVFHAMHGEYPTTEQGWQVIPQAQEPPTDVWGNDLPYERPHPSYCQVRSAGPDGKLFTDDDRVIEIHKPRGTNPATLDYWEDRVAVASRSVVLFLLGLIGATVIIDRGRRSAQAPDTAAVGD